MTSRRRLFSVLAALLFGAFLLWSTLSSQHVECSVVVAFQGGTGEGTASASSEADALREAQTVACGPLTGSMNDRIACSRVPPVQHHCRTL
jgi:hypothetical protein